MNGLSVVIFIPDDTAKTGFAQPTLLRPVLGAPMLAWLAGALSENGVGRFFLVCHDRFSDAARACISEYSELMTTADNNPADLLHVFLSTADEEEQEISVIAGPAVYTPLLTRRSGTPKPACVFRANRELLMDALDETFSFSAFLRDNCSTLSDYDGYCSVESPAALLSLTHLLRHQRVLGLEKQGVEITDADNCYIAPSVRVETGAQLLPGAILRGNTVIRSEAVIGPWSVVEDSEIGAGAQVYASMVFGTRVGANATVGPYAHLRPGTVLKKGAKAGNFVEIKNSTLGENTWVSHLSYVGDAEIGARCNLGCGAVTVNFDRKEKHPTKIGDDAFIGCNTSLVAPVTVGNGAYVAAGSVITEPVPDNALAIGRSHQTNKRDWAQKHKK